MKIRVIRVIRALNLNCLPDDITKIIPGRNEFVRAWKEV